ncbi:MAG: cytochrome P460 family protein [Thermoleophilia bacterium]
MRPLRPLALTVAALAVGGLAACGGATEERAAPEPTPPASAPAPAAAGDAAPLEPGLPDYVAGHESWAKLNAAPIPPAEGGDPHDGTKDVFASQPKGADGRFPDGTVIVKRSERSGDGFTRLVAVMRKQAGSAPERGDWEFVEYTRGGPDEPFSEFASGAVCSGCHMQAADDGDWAFTAR